MTLPVPILDDRSYEQLRDELTARIPVYLPEWTDLGPSDPGITLLELVAHLGESLLYRFNQIPDQTRLWLMHLLQVQPHPPRAATGLVTFTATTPTRLPPLEVPAGTSLLAGALPFRVEADLTVLPLTVTAVAKAVGTEPTDPILLEEYQQVLQAAGLDPARARPYDEVVLAAQPSAPGFTPLEVSRAVDHALWVAVHPAYEDRDADAMRTGLLGEGGALGRSPLVLGVVPDTEFPAATDVDPCFGPDAAASGPTGRPALQWQVSIRSATDPAVTEYLPVTVVRDSTDGLRRQGTIALQLPAQRLGDLGVGVPADPDLAGVDDRPPGLVDGPPVLFWLRVSSPGAPPLARLRWLGANAADVAQVADAVPELLGTGTGLSSQELALAHAPVATGTLRLQVLELDEWIPWQVVETFAASGPGDRHVVLDAGAGRVRCGDSVRGRVFPAGGAVRATAYRYGGGLAGLVPARAVTGNAPGGLTVTNPVPTVGGADAEPLTAALERIPGELSRHDRAVTGDDFAALARIVGVGRTECLPRFDPVRRAFGAAGVVTVVVWPAADPQHPDAPTADTALLRAVCARLDERRLVTTELYVVPPTYHRVAVSVGIAVKTGFSALAVRRWVGLVLHQYLAPLPPFGPDGAGWPLGHRVHGPELEAAALQVDGVDFVEQIRVADLEADPAVEGTVALAPWEVPALAELAVVEGTPPEPGTGGTTPPRSPDGPVPVPVPVPKDEC
jgi:hypothetical protein